MIEVKVSAEAIARNLALRDAERNARKVAKERHQRLFGPDDCPALPRLSQPITPTDAIDALRAVDLTVLSAQEVIDMSNYVSRILGQIYEELRRRAPELPILELSKGHA